VFLKKKRFSLHATIATLMVDQPAKLEDVLTQLEEKLKHAQHVEKKD
jgi:hypothetical protein